MSLETRKDHRDQIAALAAQAFATHEIVEEAPGQWLCKRPNEGWYWFRVALLRGALVVWGDIGEMVITGSSYADLAWLRGAIRSRGYLLEKSPTARRSEFLPGEAWQYLQEHAKEWLAERWDGSDEDDFSELDWKEYVRDTLDTERDPYDYSSNDHWCAEALACFVRLLDARPSDARRTGETA